MFQKDWSAQGLSTIRKPNSQLTKEQKEQLKKRQQYLLQNYGGGEQQIDKTEPNNIYSLDNVLDKKEKKTKKRKEKEKIMKIEDKDITGFENINNQQSGDEDMPVIANQEEYEHELKRQKMMQEQFQVSVDGSGWQAKGAKNKSQKQDDVILALEQKSNQDRKPRHKQQETSDSEDLNLKRKPSRYVQNQDREQQIKEENKKQIDSDSDIQVNRRQQTNQNGVSQKQNDRRNRKVKYVDSDSSDQDVQRKSTNTKQKQSKAIKQENNRDSDLSIDRRPKIISSQKVKSKQAKYDSDSSDLDVHRKPGNSRLKKGDKFKQSNGGRRQGSQYDSDSDMQVDRQRSQAKKNVRLKREDSYSSDGVQRQKPQQQQSDSDIEVDRGKNSSRIQDYNKVKVKQEDNKYADDKSYNRYGNKNSHDHKNSNNDKYSAYSERHQSRRELSNDKYDDRRLHKSSDRNNDKYSDKRKYDRQKEDTRHRDRSKDYKYSRDGQKQRGKNDYSTRDVDERKNKNINTTIRDSPDIIKKQVKSETNSSDFEQQNKEKQTLDRQQKDNVKGKQQEQQSQNKTHGLISATDFSKMVNEVREQERRRAANAQGQNEQTVYRERGRKLTVAEIEEREQQKKEIDEKKKKKTKEDFYEKEGPIWAKGLAQQKMEEEQQRRMEEESKKPFAREWGNEDMDRAGRDKFYWDDPMREYVMKKRGLDVMDIDDGLDEKYRLQDNSQQQGKFIVPQQVPPHSWIKRRIQPPPNRYGIRPGRHWDGVNRSNGFEEKYFNMQSQKIYDQGEKMLDDYGDI